MVGNVLMCIGMAVIGFAESTFVAILGGVIYGLSNGINMPTIFAWAIDFAKPGKNGTRIRDDANGPRSRYWLRSCGFRLHVWRCSREHTEHLFFRGPFRCGRDLQLNRNQKEIS